MLAEASSTIKGLDCMDQIAAEFVIAAAQATKQSIATMRCGGGLRLRRR
jgi:hypothetical protein